jgi:sarcosine oxidase subunit gamma
VHNLTAITALGGSTARVDQFNGMTLTECPDWALASLAARGDQTSQTADKAKDLLGFALPDIRLSSSNGTVSAYWAGPDQWMVEAPHSSHEGLAAQLKTAMGDSASVTEQTDGWVRFDLTGPECLAVLQRLCNANTATMVSGSITRTGIHHLSCLLSCRTACDHYSIWGPRSSAGTLHHAIHTAAKSAL